MTLLPDDDDSKGYSDPLCLLDFPDVVEKRGNFPLSFFKFLFGAQIFSSMWALISVFAVATKPHSQ
jgi:hypothetical protein